MTYALTAGAQRQHDKAPPAIQQAFDRRVQQLLEDLRHPGLHAKRYHESGGLALWQARINDAWRFYFTIETDVYLIRAIRRHPN